MSVYTRPNSQVFHYEFTLPLPDGTRKRFRGSTGEKTRRRALQVETDIRTATALELQKLPAAPAKTGASQRNMSLREAFGRFWNEKAQYEKSKSTVWGQLGRMMDYFGADTPLHLITPAVMTEYQTHRRKDGVKDRTISAEVPELLQRVFGRAELWDVNLGKPIRWKDLRIGTKDHRVRSASREELAKILWALPAYYRSIVRFAVLSGLRRQALLIRRDQIDWDNMVLTYSKKSRKTKDTGWLPITDKMAEILRAEIRKGGPNQEWVFTYVAERTRGGRVKGQRYPITYSGFGTAMTRALKKTDVQDWRIIHDLRHTAATNVLRSSQNIVAVQHMLGHSDIAQTTRYAHVLLDDVRKAMG